MVHEPIPLLIVCGSGLFGMTEEKLTPEQREQRWQEYWTKTGYYAPEPESTPLDREVESPVLRVDTHPLDYHTVIQQANRYAIKRVAMMLAVITLLHWIFK